MPPAAVLTILLLTMAGSAIAGDGTVLHQEKFVPKFNYTEWFERAFSTSDSSLDPSPDIRAARRYYTPLRYAELLTQTEVSTDRIIYESDGLKISGVIVRPARPSGRLPIILWCRGGIGRYGAITTGDLLIMNNWARAGYVVIASNYRGGPASEGRDENGGDDVHDVEALVPLARTLPYADIDQLFLYGQSRGGMMVYRALADGLPARAAVINSGVSDLSRSDRPDAAEMDALMRSAMPDYEAEKANHFCRRSAICWPEKLKVPLLLLHGTADWRVPADQALALAARLQSLGSPYELHIIEGGTHVALNQDQAGIDKWILDFFASHKKLPE